MRAGVGVLHAQGHGVKPAAHAERHHVQHPACPPIPPLQCVSLSELPTFICPHILFVSPRIQGPGLPRALRHIEDVALR